MSVETVAMDPHSANPVVVLKEIEGTRRLLVWVGHAEAQSIAAELKKRKLPRPNSHDLARNLLQELKASISEVAVVDLREGTYFALLTLQDEQGQHREVDARPSDAIALALRFGAPIFIKEMLFERAREEFPAALPGQPI